jgi:putative hydrolase of the HAD superfamily
MAASSARITTIGFDADDTLWHNESIFEASHRSYCELLSRYHDAETVERTLFATEMRNLDLFGYGIKSHALSSVETAIELSGGQIRADEIRAILDSAKQMLAHPVELL